MCYYLFFWKNKNKNVLEMSLKALCLITNELLRNELG